MQTPASTITTIGDLGGRKVGMEIDSSAMAHIMSILTDLYSDPEGAVIREYSTNALDAHVEAGNPAPIEISTPSTFSSYFKVKDYGVGLSVDDIVNMYSKYGASTKRGTNEQVGMLGLGAKSALTLVPQFSLTSVKDGVRIVVSISRSSDGSGQMEIIDTKATDEPNGVEISIPVPRSHNFAQKCKDFFRFWKKGTVLIDGREPDYIEGRPVGDKFIINSSLRQDYIVMGNVAYPVKESLYTGRYSYNPLGIVAYVNIGDVNFTPSREELHYTPKTKETIEALKAEFNKDLNASSQADIDAATDHIDAWKRAVEWKDAFGGGIRDLTYRGSKIPYSIPFAKEDPKNVYSAATIQGKIFNLIGRNPRYSNWIRAIEFKTRYKYLYITGFAESLKPSPTQREKAAIYAQQRGWSVDQIALFKQDVIVDDPTMLPFIKDLYIVAWEDIAKIKVPRKAGVKTVRTDPYDLYVGSWNYQSVSVLDTNEQIIYISPAENKRPDNLINAFPDAQIVMLGMNRWDKFKRDYPTAKHYVKALSDYRNELKSRLSRSDKILMKIDHYARRRFEFLRGLKLDDPDINEFIKVLFDPSVQLSADAKKLKEIDGYSTYTFDDIINPLTKYPFAGSIDRETKDHAEWYINSYYAHIIKEN